MQKLIFIALGILIGSAYAEEISWDSTFEKIRKNFPEIKEITVEELKIRMDKGEEIELFDVREKEEFQVSHIKGARNLRNAQDIAQVIKEKRTVIVCYCSVGYRSGKVVKDLHLLGFQNSYNLKGSIFEWANKGNAILENGKETHFVHPYDEKWGKLLKKEMHKY